MFKIKRTAKLAIYLELMLRSSPLRKIHKKVVNVRDRHVMVLLSCCVDRRVLRLASD